MSKVRLPALLDEIYGRPPPKVLQVGRSADSPSARVRRTA